jgi:predicted MFS family arabinose efflux permease
MLLASIGWRGLFGLFAALTIGCAAIIYLVVPEAMSVASGSVRVSLKQVYINPRFWRLAPLSATSIGTAWALHGLWASQWLTDVEGLDRPAVVRHLFVMAVVVSVGALLFGVAVGRLRRRGVGPQALLGIVAVVSMVAQLALILRWPLPSYFIWTVVAMTGAATVLSYAALANHFPKELAGRANGLLNFFHVGTAFVVQSVIGLILQFWTPVAGHYPDIAYQTAFTLNLAPQVLAAIWFGIPWLFLKAERKPRVSTPIQQPCKIRQVPGKSISGCVPPFLVRRSS